MPQSYLNLPIAEFKELIIRQLKKDELVWFGYESTAAQIEQRSISFISCSLFLTYRLC